MIQQQWDKRWIIFLFYSEHAGNIKLSCLPNVVPNSIQFIHKKRLKENL